MFTQRVMMQVTAEQYQKDLKEKLIVLGYREWCVSYFLESSFLVTGSINHDNIISIIKTNEFISSDVYFIDHYNPYLFLALAAITDSTTGIVGEWYMCKKSFSSLFTDDKPYVIRAISSNDMPYFTNDIGKLGAFRWPLTYMRKATASEIINHFTKQKSMESRFPFILTEENYKRIVKAACNDWQETLVAKWGLCIVMNGTVAVSEQFYKEMRSVCTPGQHELFDEIFGKDEPEWSLKDAKNGEPVWVRDFPTRDWVLRYADGKGCVYKHQRKSGDVTGFRCAMKFDPNNLPVNS